MADGLAQLGPVSQNTEQRQFIAMLRFLGLSLLLFASSVLAQPLYELKSILSVDTAAHGYLSWLAQVRILLAHNSNGSENYRNLHILPT